MNRKMAYLHSLYGLLLKVLINLFGKVYIQLILNDIRHITNQATVAFDLIEQLGNGGSWWFFTPVKIPYHSWMTQRGQYTEDVIFQIFLNLPEQVLECNEMQHLL